MCQHAYRSTVYSYKRQHQLNKLQKIQPSEFNRLRPSPACDGSGIANQPTNQPTKQPTNSNMTKPPFSFPTP
jgi:hypothetical protein